jgi:hypothetical protein
MLACSLDSPRIKYIYCTDTIVDQTNQEVLDLTQMSLQQLGSNGQRIVTPTKVAGLDTKTAIGGRPEHKMEQNRA